MSPEADLLVEQAIDAFVEATSIFDFETAERALVVALAASTFVDTNWGAS